MTEKRFLYDFEDPTGAKIVDYKEDKEYPLETIGDFMDIEDLLNELNRKYEQLNKTNEQFLTYDKSDFIEAGHINNIYKEYGFKGVINYAKDKLQQYGAVREESPGLWVLVTGGWNDNENWINSLNHPASIFMMKHYCAYTRGGAFYYSEEPHCNVELKIKEGV